MYLNDITSICAAEHSKSKVLFASYEYGISKIKLLDPIHGFDSDFGINGEIKFTALEYPYSFINKILVLENGDFICFGYIQNEENEVKYILRKYKPNGKPDESFGFYGIQMSNYDINNMSHVLRLGNNKYILGGTFNFENNYYCKLVCMNSDGSIDSSFGVNGASLVNNGKYLILGEMKLTPYGNILVAVTDNDKMGLIKLFLVGQLDKNFGTNGIFSIPRNNFNYQHEGASHIEFYNDNVLYLGGTSIYSLCDSNGCKQYESQTIAKLNYTDTKMPSNQLNKSNKNDNLIIYTNPVGEILYIKNNPHKSRLHIYNSVGEQVYFNPEFSQSCNIENLSAGIYVVKMIDKYNATWAAKIIKK